MTRKIQLYQVSTGLKSALIFLRPEEAEFLRELKEILNLSVEEDISHEDNN